MIDHQELPPKTNSGLINKNRISSLDEWAISPVLKFDPEVLAYDKWEDMLDATKKNGLERGLTVAWDGKRLITGNITQGSKDTISPQFFPRGIRSIFSRREKNLVTIHTHPMPPELNHLQTMPLSDKDINSFINSNFKAMISIDRGGVHMLARNPYSFNSIGPETDSLLEFEKDAIAKAKENTGLAVEVMQEIAIKLKPLGINYYYSPGLSILEDGYFDLTDVLKKS